MANSSWRIGRPRGGAQLPLALLAALAIALILIGKAQSNLFDRARANLTDWAAPALEVVRAPLAGINRFLGSIGDIFHVYEENLKLKEENARLRQWHNQAVVLDDRVKRYQLLLHAVPDPALTTVMAQVKPGQAVIDARGMIGRIFLAGDHTSWVILLTDLNSRVPVTVVPGNVQAIMAGDNSGAPTLDLLSQNVTLKPGMQVVTSGDGGLLPPGLAVGIVVANPGGGFRVALLADPASSETVNVVDFKNKTELPPAVSPKDLPAAAAGLPPAAPPVETPPAGTAPAGTPPAAVTTTPKPAKPSTTPPAQDGSDPGDE